VDCLIIRSYIIFYLNEIRKYCLFNLLLLDILKSIEKFKNIIFLEKHMERKQDLGLVEKVKKNIKKALVLGAAGLVSYLPNNAVAQSYDFANPQHYVEIRTTEDALSRSYTPLNGGNIDSLQYEVNSLQFKVPVEEGIGSENYLLHGAGYQLQILFSDFTNTFGENYSSEPLIVKVGQGLFVPTNTTNSIDRPTRIEGILEGGNFLSEFRTNTALRIRSYCEFDGLNLPGLSGTLSFVNDSSGVVVNSVLSAPMMYNYGDNLTIENCDFLTSGTAIYVSGNGSKNGQGVNIRFNRFIGNDIAFDILEQGVDAGDAVENGNNQFINVETVVRVREGTSTDQNFQGNYWEVSEPEKSTRVLTNPDEILARQVINEGTGQVFVYNALGYNPLGDTDGDGLSDWDEVNIYGTDPYHKDTDRDGLTDWEEVMVYGTDPLNPDSDCFRLNCDSPIGSSPHCDGFTDGEEVQWGWDPCDPTSPTPGTKLPVSSTVGLAALVSGIGVLGLTNLRRRKK
jgi:hypothetical protein